MDLTRFSGIFVGLCFLLCMLHVSSVDCRCEKRTNKQPYPLRIGELVVDRGENYTVSNQSMRRTLQKNLIFSDLVQRCFENPHFVGLLVQKDLHIYTHGWKDISAGMKLAFDRHGVPLSSKLNMIIGPFYTNLAMILERQHIPYLVTDYKGFDQIDMSRAQDRTKWRTIVEIRPPTQEQNTAVVDLFQVRHWENALMVMPESEADNQECQDLAQQMVGRGVSLIPYTINPSSPEVETMARETIRNSQLLNQKTIVVCSPRDARDKIIERILVVAKLYNLLVREDQSFIFVDSSSNLQPLAGADQMYRLHLFSARCQLLAFRYFRPQEESINSDANAAIGKDAGSVTKRALSNYLRKIRGTEETFQRKRLLSALRKVELHGQTGYIRFNSSGQRINYTLHLYDHGGEDMYRELGEWTPSGSSAWERLNLTGYQQDGEKGEHARHGIFPNVVKVVVVLEEPFVMPKTLRVANGNKYEGFTVDLLNKLKEELNFQYEIYVSPNNAYGVMRADGSWDGMVREIIDKKATLAMGAISITSQRESAIDFSQGIISTGYNILIAKPQVEYNIFQFLRPFSLYLWLAIIGASTFVSFVLFSLDYPNPEPKFTPKETLWYAIGTLLKRGTDFSPKPISQRILSAGFTFFVLITVSTYTANMAAFLTTKSLEKTISSFEDLADSSLGVCTVDKSATMKFLQRRQTGVFERIWEKVQAIDGTMANSSLGRISVENKRCAFIFDYLINMYFEFKYCETKAVAPPILIQEHGIGMPQGAAFKTKINIALLKLKETGFIASLKKKWWDDKRQCDVINKRAARAQFGIYHTAGVFILALFGLVFAVLFFVFKKFYLKKKMERAAKKAEREKELLCRGSPTSV